MLRSRLWDLDHLVSRTVTYPVVTAVLALPYLLVLPAVTTWPWPGSPARLRDQVDLDALQDELLTAVDETVQPTRAWLWLRPHAPSRTAPQAAARHAP